jgi:hypothetical protein
VQVLELLITIVHDFKVGIEVASFAALALSLVYVGSCNEDVVHFFSFQSQGKTFQCDPIAYGF